MIGDPMKGHYNDIRNIAFSPKGACFASASYDGTIRVWEIYANPEGEYRCQCTKVLKGHDGRVQSVCFSPNGSILASASMDTTIRLWVVLTGI